MPLPLGLPHLGNCVANMFANPYPIVETVYLLKGPHVPIKSRLRAVFLEFLLLENLWRSAICLCERPAICAATSAGRQILTYHISSKRETARSLNQKLSSTFWVVNQTQTASCIHEGFPLNRLNQVWFKIFFAYLNWCKCSDGTPWKDYPEIIQT